MTAASTAQTLAAIAASVGALGTWAAAYAALQTARRADETSKRATTALARSAWPTLKVYVRDLPEPGHAREEPKSIRLWIGNLGAQYTARDITLEITRADGAPVEAIELGPVGVLGPGQNSRVFEVELSWPRGFTKEADSANYGGEVAWLSLTYWDLNTFMRWHQKIGRIASGRQSGPDDNSISVWWDLRPHAATEIESPTINQISRYWRAGSAR